MVLALPAQLLRTVSVDRDPKKKREVIKKVRAIRPQQQQQQQQHCNLQYIGMVPPAHYEFAYNIPVG